jgi:electron-transferring-flavoprotein dehydrogenase
MNGREVIETDVLVVGAGPSGLSAAIRLKQLSPQLGVIVIEMGAEVGAHILSGAVIDPCGLDRLVPQWRREGTFARAQVTADRFMFLTRQRALAIPSVLLPAALHNRGNFAVSLGDVCRYLDDVAEALGVDVLPGFAGSALLRADDGAVIGVATGDHGRNSDGSPGDGFSPGTDIRASYTILAEGARGSLSLEAIRAFDLDSDSASQKFGLGFKELWEIESSRHSAGRVEHYIGWPLPNAVGGGGFLYHLPDNRVSVGLVVHLDYENPYLSPFEEFQRFKLHPHIRAVLEGGERIGYGARTIVEGGAQSVPQLAFPGGVLVGDAAGFVNLPRIKGSHNAVLSGMLAAEHIAVALAAERSGDTLHEFDAAWRESAIGEDLLPVRNAKPLWSAFGTLVGIPLIGLELWCQQLCKGSPLGTLSHGRTDRSATERADIHQPISYPRADVNLTFDRLSSVYLTGTHHRHGQPQHLQLRDRVAQNEELTSFAGLSARYCPAGVYEWRGEGADATFVINQENCIHCKTCDVKDPADNIRWTAPEGGDGPNYRSM